MAAAEKKKRGSSGAAKSKEQSGGYLETSKALSVSMLWVFPLLLMYEIGLLVLQPSTHNGAGVIVKALFSLLGDGQLVFHVVVLVGMIVAAVRARKHGGASAAFLGLLILETIVWAAVMMICAVTYTNLLKQGLPYLSAGTIFGPAPAGWDPTMHAVATSAVFAAGAGVYEEIVFRLLLLTALLWVLRRLLATADDPNKNQAGAAFLAIGVSAVLFSLAHHVGSLGEPLELGPFLYRTVCGVVLGVVYVLRGFAAAVYTHAIYDFYVFMQYANAAGLL